MAIDLKRRKTVMSRSIKLGHCVCDPKKPCPCDLLKQYNVCQCAGERLPVKTGQVPLTQLVHRAGCASKIGQADLLRILGNLPPISDPRVLVGTAAGDDAGVYQLDERFALVQTVDVFTPCVDDPYLFGQIAAANSLSDVYAMGGKPLTALSIIGFPIETLDGGIMEAILQGGIAKLSEANCALIGGHSINDEEIKCGFAVTGVIDATQTVQRDTARPGDSLVLTKPLGTGIIAFAAQLGRISAKALEAAGAAMATLNKDAAELMAAFHANACTDITGYGLAGHLVQMVRGSGVNAEIDMSRLPVFAAVKDCIDHDILPGSIERNQDYAMAWTQVDDPSGERDLPILYDPQTSGGLLIALPEGPARELVAELQHRGHAAATIIGRITEKTSAQPEGKVIIINATLNNFIGEKEDTAVTEKKTGDAPSTAQEETVLMTPVDDPSGCCAAPLDVPDEDRNAQPLALFTNFMKEVNKPGLIDARAKKLMAIALSVAQRCAPCLKIHIRAARSMGISMAEIDEAANLAIAFAGCAAMMFYKEIRETCQE